jgi:hypothetical protein
VYWITLFVKGSGRIALKLSPEQGEERKEKLLPSGEEVTAIHWRVGCRSFHGLELCLEADGQEPLHLFGIELRGKISDQTGKE